MHKVFLYKCFCTKEIVYTVILVEEIASSWPILRGFIGQLFFLSFFLSVLFIVSLVCCASFFHELKSSFWYKKRLQVCGTRFLSICHPYYVWLADMKLACNVCMPTRSSCWPTLWRQLLVFHLLLLLVFCFAYLLEPVQEQSIACYVQFTSLWINNFLQWCMPNLVIAFWWFCAIIWCANNNWMSRDGYVIIMSSERFCMIKCPSIVVCVCVCICIFQCSYWVSSKLTQIL